MTHSFGLVIESLVTVLLTLTIGYCMLLNSRLKRLKADEQSHKATIAELITATEIAERAIGGLKLTVRDVNENLGSQLAAATQMSEHLNKQLAEGDNVLRRLSRIVSAARPAQEQSAVNAQPAAKTQSAAKTQPSAAISPAHRTSASAIAAAAQAFSERRRADGLAA
jgi:hypothetical protein